MPAGSIPMPGGAISAIHRGAGRQRQRLDLDQGAVLGPARVGEFNRPVRTAARSFRIPSPPRRPTWRVVAATSDAVAS
jgi:hypothetical protein